MKCEKCGNTLFRIQVIPCCADCNQNPAYDEAGDLIYDEKVIMEKELIRDGVEINGECAMGSASGAGCYMFHCYKCGWCDYIPIIDGC